MLNERDTLTLVARPETAKCFDPGDPTEVRQALRHLKRGGTVMLDGSPEAVLAFHHLVERRSEELVQRPVGAHPKALDWERCRRELHSRVLAEPWRDQFAAHTDPDSLTSLVPLSVAASLRAEKALQDEHYLEALGAAVLAHPEVLAPRSQPTINLIKAAVETIAARLPTAPRVLDMGCGTGCCGFVAAKVLAAMEPHITATDHSPYAIATTRLNTERLVKQQIIPADVMTVTAGGDLYAPVSDQRFELIIFNAPWVVAPAKTLAETAINDGRQETMRRFLAEAHQHLRPSGRVIVGYADHSGPKAVRRLERFITDAGLAIEQVLSDRIQTHRSQRKWERIFAYILERSE